MNSIHCEDLTSETETNLCFEFQGFNPSPEIEAMGQELLKSLAKLVPIDSSLVSRLDYNGQTYSCSFDLFQKQGSLYAIDLGCDAVEVMKKAANKLKTELLQMHFVPLIASRPQVTLSSTTL